MAQLCAGNNDAVIEPRGDSLSSHNLMARCGVWRVCVARQLRVSCARVAREFRASPRHAVTLDLYTTIYRYTDTTTHLKYIHFTTYI